MIRWCVCGDNEDDHGSDPDYPGSTACNCDGCECVAFEHDPDVVDARTEPARNGHDQS